MRLKVKEYSSSVVYIIPPRRSSHAHCRPCPQHKTVIEQTKCINRQLTDVAFYNTFLRGCLGDALKTEEMAGSSDDEDGSGED
jgi:hypothetical protein